MHVLNDRIVLLRALRAAGPLLISGLCLVRVIGASVPASIAITIGAIVSRLAAPSSGDLLTILLAPLATLGCVVYAGHLADAAARPLEFQARARIDGAHRAQILAMTTAVPFIAPLERPEVQQLIRQAAAEPDYGVTTPADGALAQLRWLAGLIGVVTICAVLAQFAWWLIPVLVVPAAIGLCLRSRQYSAAVRALGVAAKEELHADVWRRAAASSAEGKDVRIFGLGDWMVERMQDHILAGNSPFWTSVVGIARRSWIQFALAVAGLLPAYVLVTVAAGHGTTPAELQTAVLVSGWAVFSSIGSSDIVYRMAGSVGVLRARADLGTSLGQRRGTDARPAVVPPQVRGSLPHIRLTGVRFAYPGGSPVLDRLDLEIRPGELLAVVGLNGAGKSTLIKLLAGLYQPDGGQITAGGCPIDSAGWAAWRRRIAIVFQDFVHYEFSVADNVLLGDASAPADRQAASRSAAEAGLDEVLRQLPSGWDTPLSRARRGGVDLSGGQWQQVVLARALYAVRLGAQLLVLDEPTAHLDVRSESEVFDRLARRRGNASIVLISHRLSTVRQADRIVLLDGGRITESGSHDELMATGGTYAAMFDLQARRFADGDARATGADTAP